MHLKNLSFKSGGQIKPALTFSSCDFVSRNCNTGLLVLTWLIFTYQQSVRDCIYFSKVFSFYTNHSLLKADDHQFISLNNRLIFSKIHLSKFLKGYKWDQSNKNRKFYHSTTIFYHHFHMFYQSKKNHFKKIK